LPAKRGQTPAKPSTNKHQKANEGLPASFQDTLAAIRGAFANAGRSNTRDTDIGIGNAGQIMVDMLKRQEEMLNRHIAEFEAEKAAIKEELRQAKAEHRQDVALFKQEVAEFNNQRSQFLARREEAVCRVIVKDTKEVQLTN